MSRRRTPIYTDNHERWLISYADFITLLFAFFVVMYSTSAVNNGSFRVLSDSIERAFGLPGVSFAPDMAGSGGQLAFDRPAEDDADRVPLKTAANGAQPVTDDAIPEQLQNLQASLESTLGDLVGPDKLALSPDSKWLEIKIPASLVFPSGARALLADSVPMIQRIAEVLSAIPNEIVVQGHTDDEPIRNGQFPSNWELSTSRAAAIVRLLESEGVDPARMSAQGYAATRPLVPNVSEEDRAVNRRVVILVRNFVGDETQQSASESASAGPVAGTQTGAPQDG